MTYLEMVNAVLRKLREPTVSSVTDSDYSTLIGAFVNETKREVEDAYDWNALYTSITVTTANGDNTYNLTGAGRRVRIKEAYNVSQQTDMRQMSISRINRNNIVSTPQTESPYWYNISGYDSVNDEVTITVYPTPNGVETLRFYAIVPQDDLDTDSDVVLVPAEAVVHGAWARAISERGEDGGRMTDSQFGIYKSILADYIAIESGRNDGYMDWEAV